MTLGEAIRTAVTGHDYHIMNGVVDLLRDKYGMTCNGIREYFEKAAGKAIHPAEWDEWMRECDVIASW